MIYYNTILLWRNIVRRLNSKGIFYEINPKPLPILVIAGYTRSGTTYLAQILSSILGLRYIHEPEVPNRIKEISFFHERESAQTIINNKKYIDALKFVYGPNFKGNADQGHKFFYRGRIIKIVRGNFYLNVLSQLMPDLKFCFIIRHVAAAVASRIKKGWSIPDHTKCMVDILPKLTNEQKECISKVKTAHEKIAISWCLDNIIALENLENKNFKFIYYENLITDPFSQINNLLEFIGNKVSEKKIKKEIELYNYNAPRVSVKLIKAWEGIIQEKELADIKKIINIFGLSHLYNFSTDELPNKFLP